MNSGAVLSLLLMLSGCYKATFYQDPSAVRGEEYDEWSDFFVFGLVGTEHFDIQDLCKGSGVAQIRTGANFGTGVVGLLTLGIYTPRKFYVTCADGKGQAGREFEVKTARSGDVVHGQISSEGAAPIRVEQTAGGKWRVTGEG